METPEWNRGPIHCEVGGYESGNIVTYLIFQAVGTEIAQRQLETSSAALEIDLECDEGVGSGLGGGSHGEIESLSSMVRN